MEYLAAIVSNVIDDWSLAEIETNVKFPFLPFHRPSFHGELEQLWSQPAEVPLEN